MASTMNEPAIRMHGIHKSFGANEVLRGIDLAAQRGETLSIIGPSGSGKSTLLRCINRLEDIDKGSIEIDGDFLAAENEDGHTEYASSGKCRTLLLKMGMVFQQFNLFPHMTVLQNLLEAPVEVKGMKREEILPTAEELLRKVGLFDKRDAYPARLSGGQQQRVLLARALCATQKLLLLDEPVSGLDPRVTAEMYQTIKSLNDEGISIIMISHDVDAAVKYASHILHIGNTVFYGTTDEYVNSHIGHIFLEREGQSND